MLKTKSAFKNNPWNSVNLENNEVVQAMFNAPYNECLFDILIQQINDI